MAGVMKGRVALVTGGSRGIGRAIAVAFAKAGANIAIAYRQDRASADAARKEIEAAGARCAAIQADVSRSEDVARLTGEAQRGLGGIDVLVNNAGIAVPRDLSNLTEQDWHETIAVNLTSAFLVTHAVLPRMLGRNWGRIINLSSTAAQVGGVVGPHYAASKAGVIGLTRGYASWLAKSGITVNAIAPALIETEMIRTNPRVRPDLIPMGRFGDVDEVARVALMLAENGYITGQTININGGLYMS
jgi:3-oxoacyl-[acyl-carrier protein] reductase